MTVTCPIELCMECAGSGQVTRWWDGWPWEPKVCTSCRGSGDAIVVGLDTVQIPVRPREYEIHMVRATAAIGGGCPITACLCGFDHHAADVGFSRPMSRASRAPLRRWASSCGYRSRATRTQSRHGICRTTAPLVPPRRLAIETLAEVNA